MQLQSLCCGKACGRCARTGRCCLPCGWQSRSSCLRVCYCWAVGGWVEGGGRGACVSVLRKSDQGASNPPACLPASQSFPRAQQGWCGESCAVVRSSTLQAALSRHLGIFPPPPNPPPHAPPVKVTPTPAPPRPHLAPPASPLMKRLTSSLYLPFHSAHTSQLGKWPTFSSSKQQAGAATRHAGKGVPTCQPSCCVQGSDESRCTVGQILDPPPPTHPNNATHNNKGPSKTLSPLPQNTHIHTQTPANIQHISIPNTTPLPPLPPPGTCPGPRVQR